MKCRKYKDEFGTAFLAQSSSVDDWVVDGDREDSDLPEADHFSEALIVAIAPGEYVLVDGLRSPCCICLLRYLLPSGVSKLDSSIGHGRGVVQ